jgi:hypothetical protein
MMHNVTLVLSELGLVCLPLILCPSKSTILKVLAGSVVEPNRYKPHLNPNEVQAMIGNVKAKMVKQFPSNYYRDLVAQLVQKGFLQEERQKARRLRVSKTRGRPIYCLLLVKML